MSYNSQTGCLHKLVCKRTVFRESSFFKEKWSSLHLGSRIKVGSTTLERSMPGRTCIGRATLYSLTWLLPDWLIAHLLHQEPDDWLVLLTKLFSLVIFLKQQILYVYHSQYKNRGLLTKIIYSRCNKINKDHQRMMVDPMFMIVKSLRSFLTAVTPTAVAPIAVILPVFTWI